MPAGSGGGLPGPVVQGLTGVVCRTRCGLPGTAYPLRLLPLIERSMPVPGLSLLWVVFQGVQDVFELFGGERSGVADEQCAVRGDDGGERQA